MNVKWGFILCLSILIETPVIIYSQATCTGTFGDNIFTEGDFGSGVQNILTNVSDIAPGYVYTSNTPPMDGYYTITNNMGQWVNNYDTWVDVGDNSDDVNGYMMVVNASYSPGIFYEQTIDNLCPNTTFEFSADILNVVRTGVTGHSQPDLEFLIDDSVRYSTGEIPQDAKWHKHGFTFSLEPGQSSLKLTLVNKAPGGIGNDLALDNITFRPCGPDPDVDLARELFFCEDEAQVGMISTEVDTHQFYIQWQTTRNLDADWRDVGEVNALQIEQNLNDPGTYFYRYKLSNSRENLDYPFCVSYSEVVTSTVLPRQYETWDTICAGSVTFFEGRILTESGNYSATYTSTRGCDSVVTLHLALVDRKPLTFDVVPNAPSCYNSMDGLIEITNARGGYPPYEYKVDGHTNNTGQFVDLPAGNVIVQVRDHFGCQFSETVELINPPEFVLSPFRDTQLVLGEALTININATQPILALDAMPNILVDCAPCQSVTFIPTQSTDVLISARNMNDCISEESFYITVDDQNLPIAFPNAFTPNGDGVNDDFRIIAPLHLVTRMVTTRILDRWGNEIYSTFDREDVNNTVLWDGVNKGQTAEPGIYAYVCELELINGETRYFSGEVLVTGL